MITTTFTCDRCGHAQSSAAQMWHVRVFLKHAYQQYGTPTWGTPKREALWCRSCCEEFILLPSKPEPEKVPEPPPLEELVREICRDEIVNARSA